MARFSGVYAGLRPLRRHADTAGLGAIRPDLGSGIGLLPKRGRPRREQRAVSRARAGPSELTPSDREFVAQHKDLELLGPLAAKEQHRKLHRPRQSQSFLTC